MFKNLNYSGLFNSNFSMMKKKPILADFQIPTLLNDIKIWYQTRRFKNHLRGEILYRSLDTFKKRRRCFRPIYFDQKIIPRKVTRKVISAGWKMHHHLFLSRKSK